MITKNYLGKLVGPSATFSGYILMIFGVIATYFTFTAIPLIIIGGIMAFSYALVFIDDKEKQFKYQVKFFGFIPIGSYKAFKKGDEIRFKHCKGKYYTYSRSNRQSSISVDDYRVYLIEGGTQKKITLGIYTSEKDAIRETNRLTELIQLIK